MKLLFSFKDKNIFLFNDNVSRVTELKKYLNDAVFRGRKNLFLFRLRRDFFLLEQKDSKWNDHHSFKDKHIYLLDENVSRVRELKKYLNDVVVRARQSLFLFRLGRDFFLLEQKDSKWSDRHSFKHKHILLLDYDPDSPRSFKTICLIKCNTARFLDQETSCCMWFQLLLLYSLFWVRSNWLSPLRCPCPNYLSFYWCIVTFLLQVCAYLQFFCIHQGKANKIN